MMRSLHPHLFGEPSPVATQTKVKVGNGEAPKFSQELNIISACVKDMEQSVSCPICLEAFKRWVCLIVPGVVHVVVVYVCRR